MDKDNPDKTHDQPETTSTDASELDEAALDAVNGGFFAGLINKALASKVGSVTPANQLGMLAGASGNVTKAIGDGLSQTAKK